jgi:hypothetical protein
MLVPISPHPQQYLPTFIFLILAIVMAKVIQHCGGFDGFP